MPVTIAARFTRLKTFPYNPQVLLVSLVTGKKTYTRAIQTDKLGNEFAQYGTGYGRDRSFSSIIIPMN